MENGKIVKTSTGVCSHCFWCIPFTDYSAVVVSLPFLQYNELVDKVTSSETKVSEMETTVEDLQWDMEKLRNREQKLNKHLAEAMEQVRLIEIVCVCA